MKIIVTIVMLLVSLHAEEGIKKVVYDLTTGSVEKFSKSVLSGIVFQKNHYDSKLQELRAIVVVHGEAYRFFLKSLKGTKYASDANLTQEHSNLLKRIESLNKNYGVVFEVCEIGFKRNQLVSSQLIESAVLIPSSTTGLIDAQNEGYAYVPVH